MNRKITKRIIALAVMLAMIIGSLPVVYAERGKWITDTTTVPGWSVEIQDIDGGACIDSSEHASGKQSMKLWNNTLKENDNTFLRASYPVSVEKGKFYRYGFKAKVKNATNVLAQMNWGTRSSLTPVGRTSNWREFEFNYNHTDADGTAWLRIILDTKSDAVWIDDVYFYEVGDATNTNLINNPSFEETAASAPAASAPAGGQGADGRDIVAVAHKDGIEIDGDLSDWDGISALPLTQKTVYNGTLSIEANIRYAYDDENFYFATEVEDDEHFPVMQNQYWTGDGLQFTLCGLNDTFGKAYAYSHDIESDRDFVTPSELLKHGFSREGKKTIYEVAIPWEDFFPEGRPDAALFCAIINDNDGDGLGRKGCLMVAEGIASYKGSDQYPMFLMVDKEAGYTGWLSGSKECLIGEEAEYNIDLFNSSDADKNISIKTDDGKIDTSVKLEPGKNARYTFKIRHDELNEQSVSVTMSDGTSEKHQTVTTQVQADEKMTKEIIERQKANYKELVPLMEECKNRGMDLDYDEINYNILGHFVTYIEENLQKGDTGRAAYQDKVLTELYEKTKANLTAYLDGTKTPMNAPTYVTSDISVEGKHFEATVDNGGILERQPVFFVGTGHWAPSRKDIPILSKFGFNAIQPEVGGWDFMRKASAAHLWTPIANGYEAKTESSDKEKHSGERSLKITSNTPRIDFKYWYLQQSIDVKPNTTYEYGLWAKGDNVKYTWFTLDPDWNASEKHHIDGTYDWTEYKYEYTTKPGQTTLNFYITNEDMTTAAYIDDVFVREKGSDKNLIGNSSMESYNEPDAYWDIEEKTIEKLSDDFDLMAKYNLSGIFSAAPHYIPQIWKNDHPEARAGGQAEYSGGTILAHPQTKQYYETYYRTLMPRLANKPAFDGIVLMNEPTYKTQEISYYEPLYREWLKNKYGDIKKLNEKWETEYSDFEEISFPKNLLPEPWLTDYLDFNDTALPDYNNFVSGIIKEYDKNVLTQTKMMQTLGKGSIGRIDSSNNWETLAPSVDLNSCDGWAYYHHPTLDIRGQMLFYDYQTSIKETPVYNTEDHIIQDGENMVFSDGERQHNIANLWQSAVHGKGGSVIWFWDREGRSEAGNYLHNPLLTERPDTTAAIGKMTLDLNRLAKEIVSITEADANVGMLYVPINDFYVSGYMNTMYRTYNKLGENGQKTQFVVESAMDKISEVKTCIIPHVVTVKDSTFEAVRKYADNGGKLIVIGKDSLSKDEYGHDRNADEVAKLLEKAEVINIYSPLAADMDSKTMEELDGVISKLVKTEGYSDISVIDKETGKPVEDCEYLFAQYEGKYIINLCTFRDDDREIEIYVNGKKTENFTDLISTETYNRNAKAKAYTPMLIRIEE